MKKISSTLLLVALTFFAFAQKDKLRYCKYTFTDNGNELCTAIQSNSFKSDKEAAFSINKLLDYVMNNPEDGFTSAKLMPPQPAAQISILSHWRS